MSECKKCGVRSHTALRNRKTWTKASNRGERWTVEDELFLQNELDEPQERRMNDG